MLQRVRGNHAVRGVKGRSPAFAGREVFDVGADFAEGDDTGIQLVGLGFWRDGRRLAFPFAGVIPVPALNGRMGCACRSICPIPKPRER